MNKRGQAAESRLSHLGHVLTENLHGLVGAACVTQHEGGEREAALEMLEGSSGARGAST